MSALVAPAAALAAAVVLTAPSPAAAAPGLTCAAAEADLIEVDGMLDDWSGVARARAGATAPDASFDVRCLFDGAVLYLSIDVRDEHVIRRKRFNAAKPDGDDRLVVSLGVPGSPPLELWLLPGVDKVAPRRLVAGNKRVDAAIRIEDTLQPRGFSVELAVPAARLRGWAQAAAKLSAEVRFFDADVAKLAATEHQITWTGELRVAQAADLLAGFLSATHLRKDQITVDITADFDRSQKGRERLVAGGDVIALFTDRFAFARLPVAAAGDVLSVEAIDLRGDGTRLVAARVRQRGNGGSRELLTLWTAGNGELIPVHSIELAKQSGKRVLRSTWRVEPAKRWRKQARGARQVLVVRAQPAVGWDEDSYRESPARDAEPIHVPWDDDRIGGLFWINRDGQLDSADLAR